MPLAMNIIGRRLLQRWAGSAPAPAAHPRRVAARWMSPPSCPSARGSSFADPVTAAARRRTPATRSAIRAVRVAQQRHRLPLQRGGIGVWSASRRAAAPSAAGPARRPGRSSGRHDAGSSPPVSAASAVMAIPSTAIPAWRSAAAAPPRPVIASRSCRWCQRCRRCRSPTVKRMSSSVSSASNRVSSPVSGVDHARPAPALLRGCGWRLRSACVGLARRCQPARATPPADARPGRDRDPRPTKWPADRPSAASDLERRSGRAPIMWKPVPLPCCGNEGQPPVAAGREACRRSRYRSMVCSLCCSPCGRYCSLTSPKIGRDRSIGAPASDRSGREWSACRWR